MLSAIYETIVEIIKNKKINQESSVCKFIKELNQDVYGGGCIFIDIDDYLKKQDEILEFAQLFKEAIDQIKKNLEWQEERYNHALKFYQYLTLSLMP